MQIESFGGSDIGLIRLNNEDVFALLPEQNFYILADGMGGHKAGEVAAKEAVFYLCRIIKEIEPKPTSADEWVELFEQAIREANRWVYDLGSLDRDKEGMGTTLCMALLYHKTLIYAHVGDSRIYRIRKGRITQLTQDHTLKDRLISERGFEEKVIYRNVITRAIGTQEMVTPDVQSEEVRSGDIYLLCTDGLTEALSDRALLSIIQAAPTLQTAIEELISEAKIHGSTDNITALLFKITF